MITKLRCQEVRAGCALAVRWVGFLSSIGCPIGLAVICLLTGGMARGESLARFQNPLNGGPDPWMVFYRSNYYLATTQVDAIRVWKAPTLTGLKTVKPVTVWKDTNPARSTGIWAPEFHLVSNRWYLYYTATSREHADENHRMHVLESE